MKENHRALLKRGYKEVRDVVEKKPKYYMSCTNCHNFFQAEGDLTELCQNTAVLEYDMVLEDNRIYCLQWSLFKKGGKDAKSDRDGVRVQATRRVPKSK